MADSIDDLEERDDFEDDDDDDEDMDREDDIQFGSGDLEAMGKKKDTEKAATTDMT